MRILVATRALREPAGSETYVATVVAELRQLGHDVACYAPVGGDMADRLRAAGTEVHHDLRAVAPPDVAHVQHGSTALRVRARFPELPLVYVCHSSVFDIEDPPRGAHLQEVVALSDLVGRRLDAGTAGCTARLRQPVAAPYVDPDQAPLPSQPRRALLVAFRARAAAPVVAEACARRGIELETVGADHERVFDLTERMMRADIVFATGRTLLEAMALGRAAFLLDDRGSGGFVTADVYDAMEAEAFARFDPTPPTFDSLAAELAGYDPALGTTGSQLVRRHHSARVHARDLVEVYAKAVAAGGPAAIDPAPALDAYADVLEERFNLGLALRGAQWRAAMAEAVRDDYAADLERHRRAQAVHEDARRDQAAEIAQLRARVTALEGTKVLRWSEPARRLYRGVRRR